MSQRSNDLPYDGFPLRRHRNGHWYKSVWNPRTKRSEQFYFGSWRDDPKGVRAMQDPQHGWLARRDAIKGGIDNVRVEAVGGAMTLGDLMSRFLTFKRDKVRAGELSPATLGDYLREVEAFVAFQKPGTPPGGLRPEHFSAYVNHLVTVRQLGRHARKRVRAYIMAFLRYGAGNGWFTIPTTGVDWAAPATDPDSMRQARARAGIADYSDRIVTGQEIDQLLARSSPTFRAMILLGVNAGLGPADLGRLRWEVIDLARRRLIFPRFKSGVPRACFLWKRTCNALLRVRELKHNRLALEGEGEKALVFVTRRGRPYYQEREVFADVVINGVKSRKLVGVSVRNSISITFGRMANQLKLEGLALYRLRHTCGTLGRRARDSEALNLVMGHKVAGIPEVYNHEPIPWRRIRRVAKVVFRGLWPRVTPKEDTSKSKESRGPCDASSSASPPAPPAPVLVK